MGSKPSIGPSAPGSYAKTLALLQKDLDQTGSFPVTSAQKIKRPAQGAADGLRGGGALAGSGARALRGDGMGGAGEEEAAVQGQYFKSQIQMMKT